MTRDQYENIMAALHLWVVAQIEAAIADTEEDSEGYRGSGHAERRIADEFFQSFDDKLRLIVLDEE